MQGWTEEVRYGWLAIFSQENSKNADKKHSDASGCRQIQILIEISTGNRVNRDCLNCLKIDTLPHCSPLFSSLTFSLTKLDPRSAI